MKINEIPMGTGQLEPNSNKNGMNAYFGTFFVGFAAFGTFWCDVNLKCAQEYGMSWVNGLKGIW